MGGQEERRTLFTESVSPRAFPDVSQQTASEHEQLTQSSEQKGGWSFYLIMAAVATTLGSSLPVGYNIGSVNMPAETIKSFCNDSFISRYDILLDERWMDVLWSSVVSIFIVGGCTGSLLGAVLANNLGRKWATIVTSFLALAGSVLFVFCRTANSVEMLVLGRLVVGLASGLTTSIVPMYLTELAPSSLTGTLGVVCPMGVNVGVLVAQVMGLDFLLGKPEHWPYLLSAYAVLVVVCLPVFLVLPESPKHLFVVKRDEDLALKELSRLRGVSEREAGAGAEAAALRAEAEAQAGACSGDVRWSVGRVARSGRLRLPLALVCAMQAGQQTSGINAVFYYSGAIFAQAGLSAEGARYATIGCGFINVCTAILMLYMLPRIGRRPLLLFSVCSSVILLTALAVSMSFISAVSWMPFVCMIAVLGYVLVYGFGLGPIPYFIGSEMFEVAPRPAGMAWGSLANWGGNFLVGMSFPTMKAAIGAYSFLVFAAITLALFLFLKMYFLETKGKTPSQVTEVCSRGLRSRPLQDQRRSYV